MKDTITVNGVRTDYTGKMYNYEKTFEVGKYVYVLECTDKYNGEYGKVVSISHDDETVEIEFKFVTGKIIDKVSAHHLISCGKPTRKKETKNQIIDKTIVLLEKLKML